MYITLSRTYILSVITSNLKKHVRAVSRLVALCRDVRKSSKLNDFCVANNELTNTFIISKIQVFVLKNYVCVGSLNNKMYCLHLGAFKNITSIFCYDKNLNKYLPTTINRNKNKN